MTNPPMNNQPLQLWGLSVVDLHDRYWMAREVAVVRRGGHLPAAGATRVYLLTEGSALVRLHLHAVLERHYWVHHSLYLIGLKPQAGYDKPLRLAMTVLPTVAEFWAGMAAKSRPWMALRAAFPDNAAIRIPGRVYGPEQAEEYVGSLARDWNDPELTIEGVTKLGRKVRGPANADARLMQSPARPLWIGLGHEQWIGTALPRCAAIFDR